MVMFLLHVSFLLALAVIAAGLVLWQQGRQPASGPLRLAGGMLVGGAALSAICIGYYGIRYQVLGDFDRAYPVHPHMEMGRMMERGCMMEGMGTGAGEPSKRPPGAGPERGGPPSASPGSEHESHHPDAAAPL